MVQLNQKQAIGIIALSNGLNENQRQTLSQLETVLTRLGLKVRWAKKIFKKEGLYHATDRERAKMLIDFYEDAEVQAIFDVSGGDLANGVLPYLDYEVIKRHPKPFFGYSDLSVVVNAIYTKTGQVTYLYQIKNLVKERANLQVQWFYETLLQNKDSLFNFDFTWIQGQKMEGKVIGGNIRCLLKLAGTEYWPSFKRKILLLESYSGDPFKMATFLNQYKQLGVFNEINGLILGHFTEMQQKEYKPDIISLVQEIIENDQLPIIKTEQIGHGADSKCAILGKTLSFNREGGDFDE